MKANLRITDDWLGTESPLAQRVLSYSAAQVEAYKKHPPLVKQDANLERAMVEGRYGRQQLFEMVQNAADELVGAGGRVELVLTPDSLYCANEGRPFSVAGAEAILGAFSSSKRGVEIGRFGLGFKSVLGITDRPEIFSRSGSFGFDAAYAREVITRAVPAQERIPILRVGRALDPRREAAGDEVLAELMAWATTVVRLPVTHGGEWLSRDFATFPAEFLIFSSHVHRLVLDDRTEEGERREYAVTFEDDSILLNSAGREYRWRVFRDVHRPSSAAKDDGGYSADRDEVPVYWAVASPGTGRLWAFFPTQERLTTAGIFNAPWKLTDDRATVIPGRFNDELFDVASGLFLDNLSAVIDPRDPGAILEMFPGRGRTSEIRGQADAALIERVYKKARGHAVIPDQEGELQLPSAVKLHPAELPPGALVIWGKSRDRPRDWVHWSVEAKGDTRTRRQRAERLVNDVGGSRAAFRDWLLALHNDHDLAEGSRRMLLIAEAVNEGGTQDHKSELRSTPIVLTAAGGLVPPRPGAVFLPASDGTQADVPVVHPELMINDIVVKALRGLGITEVSAESLLDAQVQAAAGSRPGADWTAIWERSRSCPRELLPNLLARHGIEKADVSVRTRAGHWARLGAVLGMGRVLIEGELDGDDLKVALDEDWHAQDLDVLRRLGLHQGPVERKGSVKEPWGPEYLKAAYDAFRDRCPAGTTVADDVIEVDNLGVFAGPATPLRLLSPRSAARFLGAAFGETRQLGPVELSHRTRRDLPTVRFPHPLVWLLQQRKVVMTSFGVLPIDRAVAPELKDFAQVLPVAVVPPVVAQQLGLPRTLDGLSAAHWDVAHSMLQKIDDPDRLVKLLGRLCGSSEPPEKVPALVRAELHLHPPADIALASTDRDMRLLRESAKPYLPCPDESLASLLSERWGFVRAHDLIDSELLAVPVGPSEPIGDLFPMLTALLTERDLAVEMQRCTELRRDWFTDSGRMSEELVSERNGDVVFVAAGVEDGRPLLRTLSAQLDLELSRQDVDAILDNVAEQKVASLMKAMREASDDAERLLLAVPADVLRQRLPKALIEAYADIHGEPQERHIAELTFAAHGFETLSQLSPFLRERGLLVPSSFAGSRRAIAFVKEIGFDRGYAGFRSEGRDEVLEVEGPIDLPQLHAYQRASADAIKELVGGASGLRGLLSLPTGAGKTRVAVQALVEKMSDAHDALGAPVLWVAQTDELCEQAVQTWAEVWRAIGPNEPLRISRLWSSNKATVVDEGHQVVVATIAKLDSIRARAEYEWLAQATCVVVDEAHSSTEGSYTAVLRWLGMGGGRERVPLIGLSATPFKGRTEASNRQLAARYGNRRLDFAAFDGRTPTTDELQRLGILAAVEHEMLEGAQVPLTDEELQQLERNNVMSPSILSRVGADVDRNRRLLESLLAKPADWPILVFASSVAHAQTLAALLSQEGRTAASVSGETKRSVRRYLVERFKSGEIQVLTNYGVLTAGFDAPSIRALYIARPTYSPNLYQQMIGRGLRGPLNGGKPECLVVNVKDNLERYGKELAFHEFDYLWAG